MHDVLQVTSEFEGTRSTHYVPTRRITAHCYWSQWTLHRVNAVSHERTYGVHIYDGCNNDTQVFPVPKDVRQGSCNNDDSSSPSAKYSVCPIIPQGHVPAGLAFDRHCEALTVADTSLLVDISPRTYDAAEPTTLTAAAHFDSDMTQRLSEGSCSDVLDWQVMAWTLRWSDGSVDHLPASGRGGITQAHALPPAPGGTQQSDVTVIAHLHVLGQALDFDQSGNTVVRNVDGYVDVSNHDGATGAGSAPVNVPPQLAAGAIAVGQAGDGSLPPPDAATQPAQRAVTIRGRLLAIYPRPIVVQPGVELVDGVEVGRATSIVTGWRYTGGAGRPWHARGRAVQPRGTYRRTRPPPRRTRSARPHRANDLPRRHGVRQHGQRQRRRRHLVRRPQQHRMTPAQTCIDLCRHVVTRAARLGGRPSISNGERLPAVSPAPRLHDRQADDGHPTGGGDDEQRGMGLTLQHGDKG
jgi:hypothetical protein